MAVSKLKVPECFFTRSSHNGVADIYISHVESEISEKFQNSETKLQIAASNSENLDLNSETKSIILTLDGGSRS